VRSAHIRHYKAALYRRAYLLLTTSTFSGKRETHHDVLIREKRETASFININNKLLVRNINSPNLMLSLKKLWLVLFAVQYDGSFNGVTAFCTSQMTKLPSSAMNSAVVDRRAAFINAIALVPVVWSQGIEFAEAKVSVKPDAAFKSLVKAREELQQSREFLAKSDSKGLRDYLSDGSLNINNYGENAAALLASKQLDTESKRAILEMSLKDDSAVFGNSIRTSGAGADVVINYGGLKADLKDEEAANDFNALNKKLKGTIDSLDEVISICRSNGF